MEPSTQPALEYCFRENACYPRSRFQPGQLDFSARRSMKPVWWSGITKRKRELARMALFMRKKPEYGLGRNEVANKPTARWPLAAGFFIPAFAYGYRNPRKIK